MSFAGGGGEKGRGTVKGLAENINTKPRDRDNSMVKARGGGGWEEVSKAGGEWGTPVIVSTIKTKEKRQLNQTFETSSHV